MTVKAAINCLAYALIIVMARVNGDPKYQSYRDRRGMKKPVEDLLKASGVNLRIAGGFKELEQSQEYLSDYKITVYDGLNPYRVMFSGNSLSAEKLYLLYDEKDKTLQCDQPQGCNCKRGIYVTRVTHYTALHIKVTKVCSLCTGTPLCTKDQTKYCAPCNRWFLSEKCFQSHVTIKVKGKLVCQWRQVCRNCSFIITSDSKQKF